jgi:hypothetical protein
MKTSRKRITYTVAALIISATAIAAGIKDRSLPRQRQPSNRSATPVVVLEHQDHPAAIALDDKSIYWISDSRSSISKISKAGGAAAPIVTGQNNIRRMVLDGDRIYFNTDDEVKSVLKTGGSPITLASITDIAYYGLAVDKTNVYYVSTLAKKNQLMKVSKDGGTASSLASDLYIPSDITADGANAYWIDYADDSVKKVPINGGAVETVGECSRPNAVAVDADSVYCAGAGGVVRFRKSNGELLTRIESPDEFTRIAFDERNLYIIGVKGIYRVSKDGGHPTLLVEQRLDSTNLAVDATNLYWTNYFAGTVMRLRK